MSLADKKSYVFWLCATLGINATVLYLVLVVFAAPVWARYGAGNPRLERLYSDFIAPCCWRENLTLHDSQIAQELRARIKDMVRDGKSDDQIKAVLIAQYGKRILALPEGQQRSWLFLTPIAAAGAGLAAVIWLVKSRASTFPPLADIEPAKLQEGWEND